MARIPRTAWTLALIAAVAAACTRKYIRPTTAEPFPRSDEVVARGAYLVDSVTACGGCHTGRDTDDFTAGESTDLYLQGGNRFDFSRMGLVFAPPNLTTDSATGLARWSDDEIARSIRDGVSKNGRLLIPAMPFRSYRQLSDSDTHAVVAYLRTLPAAKSRSVAKSKLTGLPGFLVAHGAVHERPVVSVPEPDKSDRIAYGRYIAHAAFCPDCHARKLNGIERDEKDPLYMAGGAFDEVPGVGRVYFRNLTPDRETGLGRFDAGEIKRAIRTGTRLDGRKMAPPMAMFIPHWSTMTDEDLDALVAWLKSLPPARNDVPGRRLDEKARANYGD